MEKSKWRYIRKRTNLKYEAKEEGTRYYKITVTDSKGNNLIAQLHYKFTP